MSLDSTTAINIGGVECWDEGTREHFSPMRHTARRSLRCRWENRAALMNKIRGGATNIGGVYVHNTVPYPDFPWLYPQDITIDGEGVLSESANGLVAYKWAKLTVEYSTMGGPDPQGSVSVDAGTNMITLPKAYGTLKYVQDNGADYSPPKLMPFQDNPAYPLVQMTITRSMRNLGGLPISKIIRAAENPVSSEPMFGAAAGCVLFDGGRATRQTFQRDGTGISEGEQGSFAALSENAYGSNNVWQGVWDVEYRFLVRPALPWDYFFFREADQVMGVSRVAFRGGRKFMGRYNLLQLMDRQNQFPTPV